MENTGPAVFAGPFCLTRSFTALRAGLVEYALWRRPDGRDHRDIQSDAHDGCVTAIRNKIDNPGKITRPFGGNAPANPLPPADYFRHPILLRCMSHL